MRCSHSLTTQAMTIFDVLTSPWAILPDKLIEIQAIYDAHLRGERIDTARVEQRLGRPLVNEPQRRYEIIDGVAVIPVEGVMAKRMNMFSQISGGVSTELIARDIRGAAADPAVHSIIEVFDSPGGAAEGLQLMTDATAEARRSGKRVVSLASGTMASAAYWAGSAAERVYVADAITQVGSIGVVATHRDTSGAQAQAGVRMTDIVAGRYKRIASSNGPLTEEGRQTLQQMVDYLYEVFVTAVATHRNTTVERVLADMADGRVFIGEQAITAGLADGFSTLDQLIVQLNRERTATPPRAPSTKGNPMAITREQLAAEAPDLLSQLQAEGAAAERARIQAVESALIPGHESLIASMKFDGKTSGGDAALAVNAAERELRHKAMAQLGNDAPQPVEQKPTPPVEQQPTAAKEDTSLPIEERCKAAWDGDAGIRAEFGTLAAYTAFRRADEAGRVRQLGQRAA
jgi:signal peptide peptidase SppA